MDLRGIVFDQNIQYAAFFSEPFVMTLTEYNLTRLVPKPIACFHQSSALKSGGK